MSFDRLRPQEEMRDEIIIYDSVADVRDASARGEVFIFFSHQWLGWSEPDPQRIHMAAMQQAVHNVSKDTETPLEKIRVWVDYISIPQRNRSVQKLAIASLPREIGLSTFMELSHGRFPVQRRQAGSQRFSVPFWSADKRIGPRLGCKKKPGNLF